jgi:hypothetical protein
MHGRDKRAGRETRFCLTALKLGPLTSGRRCRSTRSEGLGVPAYLLAESRLLGRQASRKQPARGLQHRRAAGGNRGTSLGFPDGASRRVGLRSACSADPCPHRHGRRCARCRHPTDQAGFLVRTRQGDSPADLACRGKSRAAEWRRGRTSITDAALSNACADAAAPTPLGR